MKGRYGLQRCLLSLAALVLLVSVTSQGASAPAVGGASPTEEWVPPSPYTVEERVLPTPYIVPTLIRAPVAWSRSTGKGATVAVIRNHEEDLTLVQLVAPDAAVEPVIADRSLRAGGKRLVDVLGAKGIRLLAIPNPGDFDANVLRRETKVLVQAGIAVFVNADIPDQRVSVALVHDLQAAGAVTVGRLDIDGRAQGADLRERQPDLFAPYGWSFDHGAALTAAAVGALVQAAEPGIGAGALKEALVSTADEMYQVSDPATGQWIESNVRIDDRTGDYSPAEGSFRLRRVNAAKALNVSLSEPWPVNALNAPAAWKTATGKGVKVALIDGGFHVDNPAFAGHLVDKAAFFPGQDFSAPQNFHGTAMAKIVLAVAPDASLVFLHEGERPDRPDAMIQACADAVDYAIAHQVDVITTSNAPWPNTPKVHEAIDRAISAGIVFVWFHYDGPNEAVIRPGYYWHPILQVGAFDRFFDDDRPSDHEGGLSDTAPQIAGIAALIRQHEPGLSPMAVKQRIIGTATVLPNGNSIADAAAAVANQPSGRQLSRPAQSASGYARLVYRPPWDRAPSTVLIGEQGLHWPFPIWGRRDVLLYRQTTPAGAGQSSLVFRAYGQNGLTLTLFLDERTVSTGTGPAQFRLLPNALADSSYMATLGGDSGAPLEVETQADQVRVHWARADGVPLTARDDTRQSQDTGWRVYEIDIQTQRLPDVAVTLY